MSKVVIYSKSWCSFCMRAKNLLNSKGIAFDEIDVEQERALEAEMVERAGGLRSVPQIFIDGKHIGGYDDMAALDAQGRLDPMLQAG